MRTSCASTPVRQVHGSVRGEPHRQSLEQLTRLVAWPSGTIYLDLTGLGCYHKQDVPAWYDELDETGPLGRAGRVLGGGVAPPVRPVRRSSATT